MYFFLNKKILGKIFRFIKLTPRRQQQQKKSRAFKVYAYCTLKP